MISTLDNCLFVHVPKVAGQSIEQVFLERAGFAWHEREQFLLKHNTNPKKGPPRLAHLTAQEYCKLGYVSEEEFSRLFKFAFVRNPWERLVSEYLYREYPFTFRDFVLKHFPTLRDDDYEKGLDVHRHILPQYDFLYDQNGSLLVDFVGRYENLQTDFAEVSKIITGVSLALPHRNKSAAKSRSWLAKLRRVALKSKVKAHYSEFFDDETLHVVSEYYANDIKHFNYRFGD